jgi:hypothetical protein
MIETITTHNKELTNLLNKVLVDGQSQKIILESYLYSVESSIESGKLTGSRRQKAEKLADAVGWSLEVLEEMTTLLTLQGNVQNDLQEIIRLTNG